MFLELKNITFQSITSKIAYFVTPLFKDIKYTIIVPTVRVMKYDILQFLQLGKYFEKVVPRKISKDKSLHPHELLILRKLKDLCTIGVNNISTLKMQKKIYEKF